MKKEIYNPEIQQIIGRFGTDDGCKRRLLVSITYANWGAVSSILIEIEGSPPKGLALIHMPPGYTPMIAVEYGGRMKTLRKSSRAWNALAAFAKSVL